MLAVLWALAVALPFYGLLRGHALGHDVIGGISLFATAVLASRMRARRSASSALASLGLCMACALAVHLSDGAIEAHFSFFVIIIVVSLYEDWRPFLIAIAFVVVHHGVMGVLDRASTYDHPGNPWALVAIHGGFVLAASVAAVVSWRMNEDVRAEGRRATEHARESDDRFRGAFEDGPVCMALICVSGPSRGTLERVNRTLCQKFGYSEPELAGSHMSVLFDAVTETHILRAIDDLVERRARVFHDELALLNRAGEPFEGRLSMSVVAGRDGVRDVIVQIEDITEHNRLGRELRDLADLDPLTGLFNRRCFERELSARLASARRGGSAGAVVLIDLDSFKEVNDTHGHPVGDQMLLATAQALSDRMRGGTDVVARLGGDEFAVLIPAVDARQAGVIGRALVAQIPQRAVHGDGTATRRTTASVGVVVYGSGTQLTGDQLLNDADLAMYEAKDDGGNRCVVYAAEMALDTAAAAGGRISWPDRIRRALEEDRLVLYAQPILDINAGEIARYELLLRMIGADGEVILPGAFLPVAERRGMIRSIDRWVVREAISLLAQRQPTSDAVRLHVNVSARSLSDPDLLGYINAELTRASVDPAALVFEITETAAIASMNDARRFLASLSKLGCGVALDDFGAGFASFHYLKNLPFDEVKIDGQFIQNLTTNPDDLVLVQTLVRLSRGLGKRTVAEFVEDAATLQLIRDLGVDFAQGYFIGRPEPAQALVCSDGMRWL